MTCEQSPEKQKHCTPFLKGLCEHFVLKTKPCESPQATAEAVNIAKDCGINVVYRRTK